MLGRLFRHRTWTIGIAEAPIHAFLEPGYRPRVRFLDLPLDDRYFADPFGIADATAVTVLCEAFDYRTWRGSIVAFRAVDGTSVSPPITVLSDQHHMSYPFLVQDGGDIYCIPERAEAREVVLYVARPFPTTWMREATLLTGVAAADATVFRHDGLWWLAYTDVDLGPYDNLCLCYAERLRGPWQPHPGNPVKRGLQSARPAGTPFLYAGTLYRPAQDSSRTYGGRVVINRVTALTPTSFAEEFAAAVEPDPEGPFPNAVHTLAAAGSVTLFDARRDTLTPVPRVGAAIAKFRRAREVRRAANV